MLSQAERTARYVFYSKIFGAERIRTSTIFPSHLWPIDAYDKKIAGLQKRGFNNPQKMIASSPAILSLSPENIDRKIERLEERGFEDPVKMIASSPAILKYSPENIDRKIERLEERGFEDPVKMITLSPAILKYSPENIDRKLRLCRRLNVDIAEFIAYSIVFIGMSHRHYIPIARECRRSSRPPSPKNVFAIYRKKTF